MAFKLQVSRFKLSYAAKIADFRKVSWEKVKASGMRLSQTLFRRNCASKKVSLCYLYMDFKAL